MEDLHPLMLAVRKQKAMAYRNRSIRYRVLLLSLGVGGLLFGAWYVVSPAPYEALKIRVVGCGAISLLFDWFAFSVFGDRLKSQSAACPQCAYSWEIKEGRGVPPSENMTNWDKCPGCGILMTEALLRRQLNRS
jgi:hypothetical protein